MRKKPLDGRDSEQLRQLGEIIRLSRRGRVSLEDLARRAEVSAGQLSHIENGRANPTVGMLIKLARALDLDVVDFLERDPAEPTYVVRADARRSYRAIGMDEVVHLLSPGIRHQLVVSNNVMRPGDVRTVRTVEGHRGEVFLHLFRGGLEVKQDDALYEMGPDCSLSLTLPYAVRSVGADAAEFLVAFRPEESV